MRLLYGLLVRVVFAGLLELDLEIHTCFGPVIARRGAPRSSCATSCNNPTDDDDDDDGTRKCCCNLSLMRCFCGPREIPRADISLAL